MKCPRCGNQLDSDNFCFECMEFFYDVEEDDDNYMDDGFGNDDYADDGFGDDDYDSMIGNGDSICLNCTYWSVSPYGSAHGMVCRRGNMTDGPGDSCGDFVSESHFASYGDSGQYQFNETDRAISNKLYHWKNNR